MFGKEGLVYRQTVARMRQPIMWYEGQMVNGMSGIWDRVKKDTKIGLIGDRVRVMETGERGKKGRGFRKKRVFLKKKGS